MINFVLKIINLFKIKKETCFICKVNSAEYIHPDGGVGGVCERCNAQIDES